MKTIGNISSWTILSENAIIKHCDKSVFFYNGSAIAEPTRWFWDVENMTYGRHDLQLKYKGVIYSAYIEYDINSRTRIFWERTLGNLFKQLKYESFPNMLFEKIAPDLYEVSFEGEIGTVADFNDELETIIEYTTEKEGKKVQIYTTKYERKRSNRINAIKYHGAKCAVCGFDFEKVYGEIGKNFIEVHYTVPLSFLNQEMDIDITKDLVCVCANCHRMIHRNKNKIYSISELKEIINKNKKD